MVIIPPSLNVARPSVTGYLGNGGSPLKRGDDRRTLKISAVPDDRHRGAVHRGHLVFQRKRSAGALQQGFRDEKPEAKSKSPVVVAAGLARPGTAGGHVRRTEAIQDLGRKTRPVVADGDTHLLGRPLGEYFDALIGEIDGVLDQIAEAIADRRIARPNRLVPAGGGERHRERDAEVTMRRHRVLDQCRKRYAIERFAGGKFGDL